MFQFRLHNLVLLSWYMQIEFQFCFHIMLSVNVKALNCGAGGEEGGDSTKWCNVLGREWGNCNNLII